MTRKALRRSAGFVTVIIVAICGGALAYPAAAAVACPACYGFARIADGVYVEADAGPDRRRSVLTMVDQSRDRVRAFYGRLESAPEIMICVTDACYSRIGGGGSRGMAVLDRALFLSERGIDPVIASHELAHIELHHRVGLVGTIRRDIPQWFDEGLAVTISDDPRYLAPATAADRCLIASDELLPTQRAAWIETAASRDLYAKAACRVSRWLAANGGPTAAITLARKVAHGESLDAAFEHP